MGFLLVVFLVIIMELYIKNKICEMSVDTFPISKGKGRIRIDRQYNKGLAMSVCKDNPLLVRRLTTLAFVLVAVFALPYLFSRKTGLLGRLGISLVLGGAASNVIDRYLRGYVVDYIQFRLRNKPSRIVTYNLADLFIFAGGLLVLTGELVHK